MRRRNRRDIKLACEIANTWWSLEFQETLGADGEIITSLADLIKHIIDKGTENNWELVKLLIQILVSL